MKRVGKNSIALGLVMALISLALSFSANGAEATKSHSSARFLSGSLLGTNLDSIAALEGLEASNPGNPDPTSNPLKLSVLGIPLLNSPIALDLAGFLSPTNGNAGVANHYAKAPSTDAAAAASGAVSDQGAILDPNNEEFPANANISLTGGLLDPSIEGLTGLNLNIGALTGKAAIANGQVTRQYQIGDLTLDLTVPMLTGIADGLKAATTTATNDLNDIDLNVGNVLCTTGSVVNVATDVLITLPVVGPLLVTALALLPGPITSLDLCNPPAALAGLIDQVKDLVTLNVTGIGGVVNGLSNFTEDGVGIDFASGKVSIDLETVLGSQSLNLDQLPANTDVLKYLTDDLVAGKIASAVNSAIDNIVLKITDVKVSASLLGTEILPATALGAITGAVSDLVTQIQAPLNDLLIQVGTPVDDLLKGLTDNLPDLLALTANNQVESPTDGSGVAIPAVTGKTYDVSALKLTLAQGDLAEVNLAAASAGLAAADATDAAAAAGDDQAVADGTTTDADGTTTDADGTTTDADGTDAAAAADAASDANADAAADADVTTALPNTGAPNVLPLLLLALGLVGFGTAVLANEKRRMRQL